MYTLSLALVQKVGPVTGSGAAAEIFSYDSMGRVILNDQYTTAMSNQTVNYTYDLLGDTTSTSNVAGATISYAYDTADRPTSVTSSTVDGNHPATLSTVSPTNGYFPGGQLRLMTTGNGLTQSFMYDAREQWCRANVNTGGWSPSNCGQGVDGTNVLDFGVWRDTWGSTDNGNVTRFITTWGQYNPSFERDFTYDPLNRLASMNSGADPSGCTGLTWGYDAWGNRNQQNVTGGSCGSFSQTADGNNRFGAQQQSGYTEVSDITHTVTISQTTTSQVVNPDGTISQTSVTTNASWSTAHGQEETYLGATQTTTTTVFGKAMSSVLSSSTSSQGISSAAAYKALGASSWQAGAAFSSPDRAAYFVRAVGSDIRAHPLKYAGIAAEAGLMATPVPEAYEGAKAVVDVGLAAAHLAWDLIH